MRLRGRSVVVSAGAFVALAALVACDAANVSPEADQPPSVSASPTTSRPTPEPPEPAEPVTIVAVGDIACDPTSPYYKGMPGFCEHEGVARQVGQLVGEGAEWFIPLGDIQYENAEYSAFREVYDKSFGRFKDITEPVAGNHEWYTEGASGYFRYFGKAAGTPEQPWRSFSPMKGWRILLLDSNCEFVGGCEPTSPQGRWIKATMKAHPTDCVLAAWHHPLRTSGEYYGITDSSDRAAELWESAKAVGVDVVLNGHDHLYERFKPLGGIQQFTVGTGGKNPNEVVNRIPGSQKSISDRYGVLALTMNADSTYSFRFVASNGDVLDQGKGSCANK